MSDYSKITNFLSKDSLALNDPSKYVKGSEIDAEYNAIAVAVATKANTDSPTITGTITAAIANFSGLVTAALGLTVSGAAFNSRGITDNATAKALTLSGSGANSVTIANSATNPTIGTSAGSLVLPSGSIFGLGSGTVSINIDGGSSGASGGSATYYKQGGVTGVAIGNTSAVIGGAYDVSGCVYATGVLRLYAGGANEQVRILNVTADRYITLSGANAANPKIATSAGSLDIGSPVVFTSQTVGTTVGATGAASALPANPLGYITTAINGTACKIPYYTA